MQVVIDIPDRICERLDYLEKSMSKVKKFEELPILYNDCPLAERSEVDAGCD